MHEKASPAGALRSFLEALFGLDPDLFVEIAHRAERGGTKGRMFRGGTGTFRRASDLEAIANEIERLARKEHVWVGVVPRRPHPQTGELGGRKENVAPARVLWADCDWPAREGLAQLRQFHPRPHMVIGSGGGYHAYWLLRDTIDDPERLRAANERLAFTLGADRQAADAARILRPPGTQNFKTEYGRPRPVELVFLGDHERYLLQQVAGKLPTSPRATERRQQRKYLEAAHDRDLLRRLSPQEYFSVLAKARPRRDGKVCCPLPAHDDPDPSCHLYETPAQGWYCFGCGRGGDVYELAGELWGLRREGSEFLELRRRLQQVFGIGEGLARAPVLTGRRWPVAS